MYIPPNSTVEIMSGVPIDATYVHTLYWDTQAAQTSYFTSKVEYTFENQSYQRHARGVIRLQIGIDDVLSTCNYMRFKNTSFENMYFYAFITNMEYVSNSVTAVYFELDVMQTWYFAFKNKINSCLIVREHSELDTIGINIQPENFELGEYLYQNEQLLSVTNMCTYNNFKYVVVASEDPDGEEGYNSQSNVFSGLFVEICENEEELVNLLTAYDTGHTGSREPIIAIYQVPPFFASAASQWGDGVGHEDTTLTIGNLTHFRYLRGLGNYYPKNNKLFTFPYNYLLMVSPDGSSETLMYERFDNPSNIKIRTIGCIMTQPECMFVPLDYNDLNVSYPNALTYGGFPTVAVASDAFRAWWAQNKVSYSSGIADGLVNEIATDMLAAGESISGIVSQGLSPLSANANSGPVYDENGYRVLQKGERFIDALGGGLQRSVSTAAGFGASAYALGNFLSDMAKGVAEEVKAKERHKALPATVQGQAAHGSIINAIQRNTASIYATQISAEYATIIDDYFTRYGYACNELKVPVYNNRPYWNYIKTKGCTLNSSGIPFEYEEMICRVFDNGITFWKNPSIVGNYEYDNSPV